jgi:hypothetical protein
VEYVDVKLNVLTGSDIVKTLLEVGLVSTRSGRIPIRVVMAIRLYFGSPRYVIEGS